MWLMVLTALVVAADDDPRELVVQVGPVPVWKVPGTEALAYESGLAIDADGAPDAYGPDGRGRDALANAGKPGNWWGVVTDTGKASGTPVVQGASDPKPGFYVSSTSLQDPKKAASDPQRYVDSSAIPYVAISPRLLKRSLAGGAQLGDVVAVVNRANGKVAYAVVADVGPRDKLGEGSIALAETLGVNGDPRRGGTAKGILYVVFPGSGMGWPRAREEISDEGARRFSEWKETARARGCALLLPNL
jgi:hypothetical protein